jgi:hypothetical protein
MNVGDAVGVVSARRGFALAGVATTAIKAPATATAPKQRLIVPAFMTLISFA